MSGKPKVQAEKERLPGCIEMKNFRGRISKAQSVPNQTGAQLRKAALSQRGSDQGECLGPQPQRKQRELSWFHAFWQKGQSFMMKSILS
jgi:hypothetical protein